MDSNAITEPAAIRGAAERLATVTRSTYRDWYPVMRRWWAAGHDLDNVVRWVESQQVSPAYADATNTAKAKAEEFEQAMARVAETIHDRR